MGLTASVGKDNDELVDNLVLNDSVKTERIEKIMRLVDRGKFLPDTERENAYKDSAWKSGTGDPGFFHMSAPCIYASVLENLDLGVGMSFLNIGSGTGYLSSMVGFIIGEKGISHGVELYQNVTEFANAHISTIQQSCEASAFDWCTPIYETGNAFQMDTQLKYDRIYCGALVPDSHRSYFCSFMKVGGVLILPYGHVLQRIVRKSEINPENPHTNQPIKLQPLEPLTLRSICRDVIRRCVRTKVQQTRQVEMRITCTESTGEKQTRNERDGEESDWELNVTHQPGREHNERRHFRPRRRLPIHIFHEDDNDQDEREDDQPANNPFHQHPMRHLFALVARERLNRHHAARARQEGGLADEANDRQIRGRIRLFLGNHPEPAQPPPTNEDVELGFRFISENSLNEDGRERQIPNVFDIGTEDDEDNEEDNNEDDEREDEVDELQDTQYTAEGEGNEERSNIGTSSEVEDDDSDSNLESNNALEDQKPKHERNSADVVDRLQFNPLSASSPHAEQSLPYCPPRGGENGARTSVKRQRTDTRSRSLDNSPQLKRTFSRHNPDQPSSSKTSENPDKLVELVQHAGEDKRKDDAQSEVEYAAGDAIDDDGNDSSTSVRQNNEKSLRLTAGQQAEYLSGFHAEFTRLLDSLPLNVQMHRFLKYELN
uniref:Protein-L-isoaspartate O-methyltransferase domain-containing protein 1 n=1 Tax=Globodera rostochiensis TaxID=31243 RepID=A0A914I3E2_GLORO